MAGFGTGFITGLAGSFDKMIQLDMKRNMDKLSRAEDYALQRREQGLTQLKKDERDVEDALKELASISGSKERAAAIAESVGGTKTSILKIRDTLRENQELLGNKFDMSKLFDFSDVDNYAQNNPIEFSDMVKKYGPKYAASTSIAYKPTGFQKLIGAEDVGEEELVGDLVSIPERFTDTETDQLLTGLPSAGQPNYALMSKAMKFENDMDNKYGSFNAAFVDLSQKIQITDDPKEKAALQKQLDGVAKAYAKVEKIKAQYDGSTPSSIFSREGITSIIANTTKDYTKPYYEVDLETGIESQLEGTQAQMMGAKMDAIAEVRTRFTDDEGYIDPMMNRTLAARTTRIKKEADAYKQTEFSKFKNNDANAKFAEVATREEAAERIQKNEYSPGTVISFKEDNITKMMIWTGTGVL